MSRSVRAGLGRREEEEFERVLAAGDEGRRLAVGGRGEDVRTRVVKGEEVGEMDGRVGFQAGCEQWGGPVSTVCNAIHRSGSPARRTLFPGFPLSCEIRRFALLDSTLREDMQVLLFATRNKQESWLRRILRGVAGRGRVLWSGGEANDDGDGDGARRGHSRVERALVEKRESLSA